MKKFFYYFAGVCICVFFVSAVLGAEYQKVVSGEGVDVMVQYDPLGPNNEIVAYVKFINNKQYPVEVNWYPVITCVNENKREGAFNGFSLNQGESLVVKIWRLEACGQGRIKDFKVVLDVKKDNP